MQVQQNHDTTLLSAGFGAIAGVCIGADTGIKKAAPILNQVKDVYVSSRAEEGAKKLIDANMSNRQINKSMAKIIEKAKEDFPKMNSKQIKELSTKAGELLKKAKLTKVKWIAIGMATGTAIGVLFDKLMSVKKTSKAEE